MKTRVTALCLFAAAAGFAQSNGIVVGRPKVFEDEALRTMLQDAETALAKLQFVDQASVSSKIGSLQGGSLTQNAFGLSVNGPTLPQVQKTATAPVQNATSSNTTGTEVDTGTSTTTKDTTSNTTGTTSNGATLQTVTTRAAQSPTAPTVAATSLSLPSSFSNSALTTLNEQMQLTYEIAGLRLLLEGSLSDRYIQGQTIPKKRVTLGFPISVTADKDHRDFVAEVEIRVRNLANSLGGEAPGLIAVLPRERTYNVANITDNSVALSGGVVTQLLNFGGSFLHSRKTYYLVQDQDTLAMQFPETEENEKLAAFGWQFRPVLGRQTVIAGVRQTFAQVSFPVLQNAGCVGTLEVLTRWRKYNAKTGAVGPPVEETRVLVTPIHSFDMTPQGYQVRWEDLGSGQSEVTLWGTPGLLMPGTSVRIGNTILNASTGLIANNSSLRFVAPTDALSNNGAFVIARDGTEVEVRHPMAATTAPALQGCPGATDTSVPFRIAASQATLFHRTSRPKAPPTPGEGVDNGKATPAPPPPAAGADDGKGAPPSPTQLVLPEPHVKIASAAATSYDASQTLVTVTLEKDPQDAFMSSFPLIAVVGGKTFGLSDAPFQKRADKCLAFLAPTTLARTSRNVAVKRLFWGPTYSDVFPLTFGDEFSASAPVLIAKNADGSNMFLLSGTDLTGAKIVAPVTRDLVILKPSSTAATFTLSAGEVTAVQQIVVQRTGGQVAALAMPKPDPTKPTLKDHDPIPLKSPSVTIAGTLLGGIQAVTYKKGDEKFTLVFAAAPDGNSVTVVLPDTLTSDPQVVALSFSFKDKTVLSYGLKVTR